MINLFKGARIIIAIPFIIVGMFCGVMAQFLYGDNYMGTLRDFKNIFKSRHHE